MLTGVPLEHAPGITDHLTGGGHTHRIPDIADPDVAEAKVYSLRT